MTFRSFKFCTVVLNDMKFIINAFLILIFLSSLFSFSIINGEQAYEKSSLEVISDQDCRDNTCPEIKPSTLPVTVSSIAYFPPPLKQISESISSSNVTGTEGKALVLKQSNGLPACLNPSSVEKLILRGWAIHVLPDYDDKNNNS